MKIDNRPTCCTNIPPKLRLLHTPWGDSSHELEHALREAVPRSTVDGGSRHIHMILRSMCSISGWTANEVKNGNISRLAWVCFSLIRGRGGHISSSFRFSEAVRLMYNYTPFGAAIRSPRAKNVDAKTPQNKSYTK